MPPITDSDTKNRGERSSQTSTSLLAPAIIAIILQLVIATLGVTVYFTATGNSTDEPPAGVLYSVSGISLLITLGLLWWYLSPQQRQSAFPLHRLSRAELGWTLVFVPLGILAFLGGEQLGILVGGEPIAFDYDVTNPVTLIGLLLGPILVSPWVEEFLYRGILIQALEDRGWSILAVGVASVGVFALAHGFILGIAGIFAIAGMAVFPTVLRLKFESITGACLHHFLNNIVAYLVTPLFFF